LHIRIIRRTVTHTCVGERGNIFYTIANERVEYIGYITLWERKEN